MAAAPTKYCVILDAGSSGTRIYVYEWKEAAAQVAAEAKAAEVEVKKTKKEEDEAELKAKEAERKAEEALAASVELKEAKKTKKDADAAAVKATEAKKAAAVAFVKAKDTRKAAVENSNRDSLMAAVRAEGDAELMAIEATEVNKAAVEAAVKAEQAEEAKEESPEAMLAEEAEEKAKDMREEANAAKKAAQEAATINTAAQKANADMGTAVAAGTAQAAAAAAAVVPKPKIATGWKIMKTKQGLHKLAPKLEDNPNVGKAVHLSDQIEIYETITTITAATTKKVTTELEPLFVHARKFLKAKGVNTAPLFLLATGGMRRLKQQNYEAFSILKEAIISYIKGSGFEDPKFDAIRGDDEGLYGWIAANSADNRFQDNVLPHGFMEMGGESAQIAVSLTPTQYRDYKGLLRGVTLGNRKYVVFAKTWPGLGVESAWRRHEAKLRECGSTLAYDPCLPNQFAHRLSGSDKIVNGTGNFPECLKETITLLGCPHKACANGQLCIYPNAQGDRVGCLLRDPLTGNTLMKFNVNQFRGASVYARATYGVFAELDPTEIAGNDDSFTVFWKQVNTLAGKNWEQLKADRPREDHKYLHKAFFMAGMIMSTLFFGFGIAMPAGAAAVGDSLAHERSLRALREALVAERQVREDAAAVDEELKIQREQHERDKAKADKVKRDANAAVLGAGTVATPTRAEEKAFGQLAEGALLVKILGSRKAIVTKRLAENVLKLHDAKKAVTAANVRQAKAIRAIRDIDDQLAKNRPRVLAAEDAVDAARIVPTTLKSPDRLQHELYQATMNTDWTLGYVVLQASSTPRVVSLSEQSWSEARFVPHNTDPN